MKRIIISLIICFILIPLKGISNNQQNNISMAIDALNSADYQKAIDIYSNIISSYDQYAPTFYGRGMAYFYLDENNKAINDFNNAIKLKSDYFDAYLGLGLAALQSGQINKSIDNLTKALGINQSDRAYYSRGIAYYIQENYKEAVNDFSSALEVNPKNLLAYYGRGISYYQLKNYNNAKLDFDYFIMSNAEEKELKNECRRLLDVILDKNR